MVILLRVRGNLLRSSNGWHLRFVPRSERWVLAISRDWLDSSMIRVATSLVWYVAARLTFVDLADSVNAIQVPGMLLRPASTRRDRAIRSVCRGRHAFLGHDPYRHSLQPPGSVARASLSVSLLNNLSGLVNAILLVSTHRLIDDSAGLPTISAPRKVVDMSSTEAVGITPFVMTPEEQEDLQRPESIRRSDFRPVAFRLSSTLSEGTTPSVYSRDSFRPSNHAVRS